MQLDLSLVLARSFRSARRGMPCCPSRGLRLSLAFLGPAWHIAEMFWGHDTQHPDSEPKSEVLTHDSSFHMLGKFFISYAWHAE